ncbi:glycosyl/glycerophosphate transferase, teichoic acid biosynthesis [Sphaerochaeta pleomorpha str. Grapes]|uniref:Glycosyl/glycerophosphate transferase, teichoic acid biosynthesis n=2 Tax=Sphaerochaeta TaxID=399320 RepID=G8QW88_SPHPG|nr:glycosyl/glycerophosphate transferase, teichoic acid biosynthesis [Sphaerochaeta pleomorpha str. Grapes]
MPPVIAFGLGGRKMYNQMFRFLEWINRYLPKRDIVLIYSGVEYKDNAKAMCDYLFARGFDKKCSIYYAEYQRINKEIWVNGNQHLTVHSKIFAYFMFLFSRYALYAFNPIKIMPSSSQRVIQMWHGSPLKKIFNDGIEKKYKSDYFTYFLSCSKFFNEYYQKSIPCEEERILLCGQPRNDLLFESIDKPAFLNDAKLIFWAPTFRKAKYWEQRDSDFSGMIPFYDGSFDELNADLESKGVQMVIKLHPMELCADVIERHFPCLHIFSHKAFTRLHIDFYSFVGFSDALITDYSSIAFDFLLLDRPIGYAFTDFASYKTHRGFVLDDPISLMPGNIITDKEKLLAFFQEISIGKDGYRDKRKQVNDMVNYYQDANNRSRVSSILFG